MRTYKWRLNTRFPDPDYTVSASVCGEHTCAWLTHLAWQSMVVLPKPPHTSIVFTKRS